MTTMTPRLRKFALTAHVTSSVGWFGAVASFLVLALAGLNSQNAEMVRATYLAMELVGWFVIVPLSLASLPTGLVMSLGTEWGLFRHYWVLAKLFITIVATILLLVHMQPVGHLARVVAETTLASGELAGLRIQLVADAVAALLVLLVATTLSVYKPKGMTAYGRRKQYEQLSYLPPGYSGSRLAAFGVRPSTNSTPRWSYVFGIIVVVLILLFVILHLMGGGLGGHH
jgi:hypothetical protein